LPSQAGAAVAEPLLQLAAPHVVALPGYTHENAFQTAQLPAHGPLPAHAARPPCGAPLTVVQVPSEPGTSHAWHCAPQVVLQQTPSTQLPERHAADALHACPLPALPMHLPTLQYEPVVQSLSPAHDVAHALPLHTYGAHWRLAPPAAQLPAPSHVIACVSVDPLHDCAEHTVDAPGKLQAARVWPSQLPAHAPLPAHAARTPTGAPFTALHVPTEPATLHASH
jgi:hypothetical protein